MDAPPICPHCGYNLKAEQRTTDGPWAYSPSHGLTFKGKYMRLGKHHAIGEILGALLIANGRVLSSNVLAARTGYEGDDPRGIVGVYMCHARRYFANIADEFPVQTVRGRGYAWRRSL